MRISIVTKASKVISAIMGLKEINAKSSVSPEMIKLRASKINGCNYCVF